MSRFMHRAEQAIQRHRTQPSMGQRSDRTWAEGWCFERRSRGRHPSKEGRRPRGPTVGDATFGHRLKVRGPLESKRRSSMTMPSPVRRRAEGAFAPKGFEERRRLRGMMHEELWSSISWMALATVAKISSDDVRRAAKRRLLSSTTRNVVIYDENFMIF